MFLSIKLPSLRHRSYKDSHLNILKQKLEDNFINNAYQFLKEQIFP